MDGMRRLEAALFIAGRPLELGELGKVTGLAEEAVKTTLQRLQEDYESRGSALRIALIGSKWSMEVQEAYLDVTQNVAPTEIPRELLRSVALIAYHQPIKQSELAGLIGERAYDHVRALQDYKFINLRPKGRTFEITTTNAFLEYFGIEARSREDVRQVIAKRLGMKT